MDDQIMTVEGNAQCLAGADSIRVSVPAQRLDAVVLSVRATAARTYVYCVRAARRLRRFITVKAGAFAAVLESRVRAFINNVFPKAGADILRQSAILNM